jgi:hypothetical protein
MDVTTMHSTITLLSRLKIDYPQFSFKLGDDFMWSPSDSIVYYCKQDDNNQSIFLLHELSHALLSHVNYRSDVNLVTMERQAWDYTKELALFYDVTISDEIIQSNLDSYRDWLHSRSTCPKCKATGLQIKECTYACPACNYKWRVNEARTCALRRYNTKTK